MGRVSHHRRFSGRHGPQKIPAANLRMGQEIKMASGRYAFVGRVETENAGTEDERITIYVGMGGRATYAPDEMITIRRGGG